MIVTREMDYAIRVIRALHQNGQMSASGIAEKEHMQRAITLKLLKQFRTFGLVESRRGVAGGYVLTRSCQDLTLYDLFTALEEKLYVNRCQKEKYCCENYPEGGCGICREMDRIQRVLDTELKRTPLSDIF